MGWELSTADCFLILGEHPGAGMIGEVLESGRGRTFRLSISHQLTRRPSNYMQLVDRAVIWYCPQDKMSYALFVLQRFVWVQWMDTGEWSRRRQLAGERHVKGCPDIDRRLIP